jgi:hypothetical protein
MRGKAAWRAEKGPGNLVGRKQMIETFLASVPLIGRLEHEQEQVQEREQQ